MESLINFNLSCSRWSTIYVSCLEGCSNCDGSTLFECYKEDRYYLNGRVTLAIHRMNKMHFTNKIPNWNESANYLEIKMSILIIFLLLSWWVLSTLLSWVLLYLSVLYVMRGMVISISVRNVLYVYLRAIYCVHLWMDLNNFLVYRDVAVSMFWISNLRY